MERLTAIENGYAYYPKCFEEPCDGEGCKNDKCEMHQKICEKLAEYEDTKLEPEDIATDYEMACIFAMQQKLKHYEDLANQGRLVELPCKVGDTVYEIKEYRTTCHCNYTFDEYNCEGCYEDHCDSERAYKIVEYKAYNISNITELLRLNKIGKTVFLTKEEAEQALAERNE